MKRFHVHLSVPDLEASIRFYSGLFGIGPTVEQPDYAKWMLDDPRVNFAISQRGARPGLDHLGLQADSAEDLAALRERFVAAQSGRVVDEPGARCCYAVSDKHWVADPQGIAWEAFHSLGTVPVFGTGAGCGLPASGCCESAAGGLATTTASECCAGSDRTRHGSADATVRACCG